MQHIDTMADMHAQMRQERQEMRCWGPSASEGPQKHDLTMSLEYNVWTGIFELELTV
jgi:hypothetical protein